jgi:hypothetical protein
LHLLFSQIAHNFISNGPRVKRWLKTCFEIEDLLIEEKELNSVFIIAVCRKKY